jgi:hypothetical protein
MEYYCFFHCKNGFKNGLQCYVIRKLPALFLSPTALKVHQRTDFPSSRSMRCRYIVDFFFYLYGGMVWRNQNGFLILFIALFLCTTHRPSNMTTLQDTFFPTPTSGSKSLFEVTAWVMNFFLTVLKHTRIIFV